MACWPAVSDGSFAEAGPRRDLGDEPQESLLAELNDLIHQHCCQLGKYVDTRLDAHHKRLLESLAAERSRVPGAGLLAPGPAVAPQAGGSAPAPSPEACAADAPQQPAPQQEAPRQDAPRQDAAASALRAGGAAPETVAGMDASRPYSRKKTGTGSVPVSGPWKSISTLDGNGFVRACAAQEKHPAVIQGESTDTNEQTIARAVNMSTFAVFPSKTRESPPLPRTAAQRVARWVVEAPAFEAVTVVVILVNVAFFGFEVQFLMGVAEEDIPVFFKVMDYLFTGCYSTELFLRLFGFGLRHYLCGEERGWNMMDLLLVVISWIELLVDIITGGAGASRFEYVRIIRIARTIRVLRVVQVLKYFRPLRVLVLSIMSTLRSLAWTLVLLGIIIYSFGVMFTLAASNAVGSSKASDLPRVRKYFGSLWVSVATLFGSITGGIDWHVCAEALGTVNAAWALLFTAYVAFSQLAVLNVVTGVVCQAAIESAQHDQEILVDTQLASKQQYIKQFQALFQDMDQSQSGRITLSDFEDRLQDPVMSEYFDAMDLRIDEAWSLFKLLDVDESYDLDIDEFVSGCLRLRGAARGNDVHMLKYESRWTMKRLSALTRTISSIDGKLDALL